MELLRNQRDLDSWRAGRSPVLVPTMGALHAGHVKLIETARGHADIGPPIVSIFVNPAQFNDASDFDAYPRTLEVDLGACERAGAAAVLVPGVKDVYPPGTNEPPIQLPPFARDRGLEDAGRPGHFEGVVRVLRRLFAMTACGAAVFGEKDWQQLLLARTIDPVVTIVPHPVEREPDGLAMSSRNVRLSPAGRELARVIPRAIDRACDQASALEAAAALARELDLPGVTPAYATVRHAQTLEPIGDLARDTGDTAEALRDARVLVAAVIDGVRLLDNAPWPAGR